jgi:hypothetical protein
MTTTTVKPTVEGAVRIGRGDKLHPARKDGVYGLMILCRCPGTQQGSAYNRASFFAGVSRTCGG